MTLSYITKITAFFFLPEAEDSDGCFVDMKGCKNSTHNLKKMLATQYIVQPAVYPHDHMADWGLSLCHCPHHKRVLYHILLAWVKVKIQNPKYNLY